ncbi:MAG: VWA domain-containing protein [Desulfosporosinus sp.]|nr:VWA domain-containing protein [Desulfosporosinus sp.]
MNVGKRITVLLVWSMLLVTIFLYPVSAQSTTGDNGKKTINLVIVLDRTKSLLQTDPNKLSQEAAKLIVDLMVQNGSKIGLVQYTDKVTDRLDIIAIKGQDERNKFKAYLDGLGVPNGQGTDISTGLKEGVSMLAGLQTLENPVIILLTDGKNDLKGSDRTLDISRRDLELSLGIAKNKKILVYTIGLNADGSVDKDMLSRIAKETGGKSYIVAKASDLPDIISNISTDVDQLSSSISTGPEIPGKAKNLFPWNKLLYSLLGIIGATALVMFLQKGIPKLIENAKPKPLFGKIKLRVINTDTGWEEVRQSIILAAYGTSVTIGKLADNPAGTLNKIVIARNGQGVCLTNSEAGSEELSVSVNGDKVAPGQKVLLTDGCTLRVVVGVESIKVEARFSEF